MKSFHFLLLAATMAFGGCAARQTVNPLSSPTWREIAVSDSRLVVEEPRPSPTIDKLAAEATLRAVEELGGASVAGDDVWTTIIDCRDSRDIRIGSYQGTEPVYPASVIKLVYMLTVYDQHRTGLLEMTEELRKDLHDMIVYSDNFATNRILDRITNTYFGPDLAGEARTSFEMKRQTATRYMQKLGMDGLWATNKTYDTGIPLYGRDIQWLGEPAGDNFERSNSMTTNDTARLLYLIWRHGVVDYQACEEMLALMKRDEESRAFFSEVVPEGATLYAKGGSTGLCRHDAGLFEFPNGDAVIIVSFSKTRGEERPRVIERVAEIVLEEMRSTPGEWDQATADETPGASQ